MQKLLLILTICFAAAAFSCNSGKTEVKDNKKKTENNFNPYFPVVEGNKWVYINDGERDETELFTVSLKDIKKTEDGLQLKVSTFPYLTKDNTERTIRVKSNGEIEINDYMGSSGVFIPAANDFKKDYKWSFGIFNAFITSVNEKAVTEDGTYENCVYVMMTDGFTFSFEMWFKKDIGIVKWGANRTNPPTLKPDYYVLKSHNLN